MVGRKGFKDGHTRTVVEVTSGLSRVAAVVGRFVVVAQSYWRAGKGQGGVDKVSLEVWPQPEQGSGCDTEQGSVLASCRRRASGHHVDRHRTGSGVRRDSVLVVNACVRVVEDIGRTNTPRKRKGPKLAVQK